MSDRPGAGREVRQAGAADAPGCLAIETHFAQTPFVEELACVAWDPESCRSRLVVVPSRSALRANGLSAVRELLRFECETLAIRHRPPLPCPSVAVSFDPLPRTADGQPDRARLAAMPGEHLVLRPRTALPASAAASLVLEAIAHQRADVADAVPIDADTNLELDLGFDSLGRAALFAEIELRMGFDPAASRIAWDDVLTAGDAAARVNNHSRSDFDGSAGNHSGSDLPAGGGRGVGGRGIWDVVLADVPASDPVLADLARPKPVRMALLCAVVRAARVAVWPWMRIEVSGLTNLPLRGPALLCPNHESFLDSFVLSAVLPSRILRRGFFLGASDYFATPLMLAIARAINLVPVDTDRNLARALRAGVFGLRQGKVLIVFPEGARSIDGTVRTFRDGAARMAAATGCVMVPIATRGMFRLWPRGRRAQWRSLRPWRPARVRIVVGAPIAHDPARSVEDTTRVLRATVVSLWTSAAEDQP